MIKITSSIARLLVFIIFIFASPWSARADEANIPPIQIKLNLNEMKIEVEGEPLKKNISLKAGQRYKLTFENRGSVRHEVLLGRGIQHNIENHELEYAQNLLSATSTIITGAIFLGEQKKIWYAETPGFNELELDPGTRISIIFTLNETQVGDWEIGCFAPGHHEAGMFISLTVQ